MRDAILRAAGTLLARNSGDPTLDQIAATAGVSARTVRSYFASAAAIEEALIADLDPDVLGELGPFPNG